MRRARLPRHRCDELARQGAFLCPHVPRVTIANAHLLFVICRASPAAQAAYLRSLGAVAVVVDADGTFNKRVEGSARLRVAVWTHGHAGGQLWM